MNLFDGKIHAQKIEELIVARLKSLKGIPTLGILQIGDNSSSEKFINLKINFCTKYNIPVKYLKLNSDLTEADLEEKSIAFFNDPQIDGVIIQLPLPKPTLYKILDKIPAKKDVDKLRPQHSLDNKNEELSCKSPVVRAVEYFIDANKIKISDQEICVLGFGFLVGRPIAEFMLSLQAKVSILDDLTQKDQFIKPSENIKFLPSYKSGQALNYQLVISSAGIPNLLKGQDIMPNSNVIDFGSSVLNNKTIGDLDLSSELNHLNIISASPGGMGPLVVRFLILNLLENVN